MSAEQGAYRVEWAAPARRSVANTPEKVAIAAVEFIYGGFSDNPQRAGRPLRLELEGLHSARRGDYRIVYRIDELRRVIVIEAFAHRADAYRRR